MDLPDLRVRVLSLADFVSSRPVGKAVSRLEKILPRDADREYVESASRVLIIPGGGAAADEIRRLDLLASLAPERSHRAAIHAMSLNAVVLARTLANPFSVVTSRSEAFSAWELARIPILCPAAFLNKEETGLRSDSSPELSVSKRLPASWDITSDSIAAWISHRWPATQLVLAKSADEPDSEILKWARCGAVDPAFEELSRGLQVQWANLRAARSELPSGMPK